MRSRTTGRSGSSKFLLRREKFFASFFLTLSLAKPTITRTLKREEAFDDYTHERTIMAGDYRVRVFEASSGEPLLFLHNAGGAGLWTESIDQLADCAERSLKRGEGD